MGEALSREALAVYSLEEAIKKCPQVELPVVSDFCHGLYARTMFIPADTILTGAIHKDESFFVVRSGDLLVTTDDGPKQVSAGFMGITKAGAKRVGYAITDVVFTTFHANPEEVRDEAQLWEHFTLPAPADVLEQLEARTCLSE